MSADDQTPPLRVLPMQLFAYMCFAVCVAQATVYLLCKFLFFFFIFSPGNEPQTQH